jgi:hypothetical protein
MRQGRHERRKRVARKEEDARSARAMTAALTLCLVLARLLHHLQRVLKEAVGGRRESRGSKGEEEEKQEVFTSAIIHPNTQNTRKGLDHELKGQWFELRAAGVRGGHGVAPTQDAIKRRAYMRLASFSRSSSSRSASES